MSEEVPPDRAWHRGLTQATIAEAALDIGLDQLTIAALADRLEVTQAALYRHFPSRDAIVGAAIELLASGIEWPSADADWRQHLRQIGVALLQAYATNPGLTAAVNRVGPPPTIVARINESATVLTSAGFSPEDAMLALTMLDSLVEGVAGEIDPSFPPVLDHVDHEHRRAVPFSAQLDILIAGLATRLPGDQTGGT